MTGGGVLEDGALKMAEAGSGFAEWVASCSFFFFFFLFFLVGMGCRGGGEGFWWLLFL